jgi:hypothetical protein
VSSCGTWQHTNHGSAYSDSYIRRDAGEPIQGCYARPLSLLGSSRIGHSTRPARPRAPILRTTAPGRIFAVISLITRSTATDPSPSAAKNSSADGTVRPVARRTATFDERYSEDSDLAADHEPGEGLLDTAGTPANLYKGMMRDRCSYAQNGRAEPSGPRPNGRQRPMDLHRDLTLSQDHQPPAYSSCRPPPAA